MKCKNCGRASYRDYCEDCNRICYEYSKAGPGRQKARKLWAKLNLHRSPEELEAKAQDLLIFANMLRKSGK